MKKKKLRAEKSMHGKRIENLNMRTAHYTVFQKTFRRNETIAGFYKILKIDEHRFRMK